MMEYKVEGKIFNPFWEYLTFTNFLLDDNHWNIFPLSNEIGLATENTRDFKHTCFQSTERFCWRLFALYFSNVPIKTNVGSGVCVGSDNISDKYSKLLHFSHFCLLSQQSYQKLMNLTAIFELLRLPCQKWKFRKLWQNKAKFLGQVLCQA